MAGYNSQFGRLQRSLAPRSVLFTGVVLFVWFSALLPGLAAVITAAPGIPSLPVMWSTGEAINIATEEVVNDGYYVLRLTSPAHNWVCGRAFFLPTGCEITLGLSLENQKSRGNVASVSKWVGLRMLQSYSDPIRYSSYETFAKDMLGKWHSTDIFRPGALGDAGSGRTPAQSAVPEDVADECLSPDGRSWYAFHELETCDAVPALNIFRVKTRVAYPSMMLSMRVPFLSSYLQQFVEKLQAAKFPGVTIDNIGRSTEGRPLWAIRLDDPHPIGDIATQRTVVMIAREHASEHPSSWATHGALISLLRDTPEARKLRAGTTWIFISLFDPDGGANSTFDNLTDRFCKPDDPTLPPEVLAYTRYITNYVATGRTLDVVVSTHSIEANEYYAHIFCPQVHSLQREATQQVNKEVFQLARSAGYLTGDAEKPAEFGMMTARFSGWCGLHFGSLVMNYEVNDRCPSRRLTLGELQGLGAPFVTGLGNWLSSNEGKLWHTARVEQLQAHLQARTAYWQQVGYAPEQRTAADLLNLAY